MQEKTEVPIGIEPAQESVIAEDPLLLDHAAGNATENSTAAPTIIATKEEPVLREALPEIQLHVRRLDPRGQYGFASEEHCRRGTCTTTYYSTPQFGIEDGEWKPLASLRSFKDTVPIDCVIESDDVHLVTCLDFNATHRILRVSLDADIAENVPIRVLTPDSEGSMTERGRTTASLSRAQQVLIIPAGIKDEVHIGPTSTNITLVPTNATSFSGWWEATGSSLALYNWTDCDANAYSSGDKTSISDGSTGTSIYGQGGGSSTDYTYCHRLKWQITQPPGNITSITTWAYWTGSLNGGADSITKALYIGNVTSQTWLPLDVEPNAWSAVNHTGNVTGTMSSYVLNESGNYSVFTLLHYNASKSGSTHAYSNFYDTVLVITTGNASGNGSGNSSGNATKGLVSNSTGATPFYTNSTNPRTITLTGGSCQNTTWYVNATGTLGNTYTFFAYANVTTTPAISARTASINLTISTSGSGGGNSVSIT